jgi:glycosyltransferase involved in cell wall biosynthesis
MKTILHISADFPDPIVPSKTKAVEWLVAAAEGFRNVVYSLNRVSWRSDTAMLSFGEDRMALAYGAPPYGFRLISHLEPVATAIAEDLRRRGVVPDLIHAHKFAVEGVIADRLSAVVGVPFISSIWGDTDTKFLEGKPGLRNNYRQIGHRAALLLPPAPWTTSCFSTALDLAASRFRLLPVITAGNELLAPQISGKPHLVSVFNWDAWHRKGFDTLLRALALVAQDIEDVRLDVYGRGGPKALLDMRQLIGRSGLQDKVRLLRPLAAGEVQETINRYAVFAMPSRRETYGMVYIEALLAGVPLLFTRARGIDGLFEGMPIGHAADPQSAADVADGLRQLLVQEPHIKAEIGRLQKEGALDFVRRDAISRRYRELLSELTAPRYQAAVSAA